MELVYKNFRAFQCSIGDYDRILAVYRSKAHIQGVLKDIKQTELFEKECAEILLENNPGWTILGVEDTTSKQLVTYATFFFPTNSPFGFLKLGETIPKNHAICSNTDTGGLILLQLGIAIGVSKGIFDIFWAVRKSSYLPMCKMYNETDQGHVTYWLLHKILYPDQSPETNIEKILLGNNYFQRKHPVAIIHTTVKAEHRIGYFKQHFSVSEETLKKCTVPNYACSTSTITSLATNS